jgi:DNA-binding transcriptional LysR family regulator
VITLSYRWPGIDLRHLAAFEAVAQTCSFARAAEALGYTQPAVSQQIAALEKAVGQRLLERGSGPGAVTPTAAGTTLLRHVEAIGQRLALARADLDALGDGRSGSLRVGTFQSVTAHVLPALVRRMLDDLPGIDLQVQELHDDQELFELVQRGALDLTFAMRPVDEERFEAIDLLRDDYLLLVQRGDPLATSFEDLSSLDGVPLIRYRSCRSWGIAEANLTAQGINPRVVFRSDDNAAVQGLVRTGLGAAVVPRLAATLPDPDVEAIDLSSLLPPREICLAWSAARELTPAGRAFCALAAEVCSGLALAV